ncbi:MAG TPA: hypothetical protein VGW78_02040 [Candidatus Babeliales bacterium]|jgi:hypothetical protein|nr:hypothetical protein [Candidatus Babeliales bacterium]
MNYLNINKLFILFIVNNVFIGVYPSDISQIDLAEAKQQLKKEIAEGPRYFENNAALSQVNILKVYENAKHVPEGIAGMERTSYIFLNTMKPKNDYIENYIKAETLKKYANDMYKDIDNATDRESLDKVKEKYGKITSEYAMSIFDERHATMADSLTEANILKQLGLNSTEDLRNFTDAQLVKKAKANIEKSITPKRFFLFSAAEPKLSVWQRVVNWLRGTPKTSLGFASQVPQKITQEPAMQTSYGQRLMPRRMPRWQDTQQWLKEKKAKYFSPEMHKQKVHEYLYGEQYW